MGVLRYDHRTFEFEDRLLVHLQIVVGLKLRRAECFYLSWLPGHGSGIGRQAIWIATGVALHFDYSGTRLPSVNRDWIEHLVASSHSGMGLNLSDEANREPAALQ
ncbi:MULTISPECIES: hypothetical protein [unclassified Rathayibacter]|uniref:DUF7882 family protein n=1 Tax=unclassified Rathayibacter TaxID=2609250 RepID=UPI00104CC327|nr:MULTISPECIES: hypothetical protein [unclassified Rathayibacter]TCL77935.1 hypothetical protein EDF49_11478 [Rathayibacter sp. PhB192]TCM23720.1 hypothetical protein EDF43_1147 [Rathayibacter sp. PhB179]